MKINKTRIIFLFIILLAAALRLFKVDQFPTSLYWDEVAIGYNAYSIYKTGRDEYGMLLPLSFESYQDSKIPGYIYLTTISEAFFGVNEFSVRFPSTIVGIGSVVIMYFLAQELFFSNKKKILISLISSFIFSILPWSLQFSRAAFEANGGLFFSILAIYLLLYFLRTKKKLLLSTISVVISLYFYYQQRIFFPLFLLIIGLLNFKKLIESKKRIFLVSLVSLFFIIPVIYQSVTSSGRLSYVSVFTKPEIIEKDVKDRFNEGNSLISRFAHNRFFVLGVYISEGYWKHFSPDFLFFNGDPNARHGVASHGVLYLWMLPFIIIGFMHLNREKRELAIVLASWILLSPIAASLSVPTPHALRSLLLLPPLVILSSLGLVICYTFIKKKINGRILIGINSLFVLIVVFFTFHYLHQYYIHEKERSLEWADGYKNLFSYLKEVDKNYDQIYVTGRYWRPYIFMLFYNQYDPSSHQQNPVNSKVGKYYFGYASYDTTNPRYNYNEFSFEELKKIPHTLLALAPEEVKEDDLVVNTIYAVNGKPVFIIIESNE